MSGTIRYDGVAQVGCLIVTCWRFFPEFPWPSFQLVSEWGSFPMAWLCMPTGRTCACRRQWGGIVHERRS